MMAGGSGAALASTTAAAGAAAASASADASTEASLAPASSSGTGAMLGGASGCGGRRGGASTAKRGSVGSGGDGDTVSGGTGSVGGLAGGLMLSDICAQSHAAHRARSDTTATKTASATMAPKTQLGIVLMWHPPSRRKAEQEPSRRSYARRAPPQGQRPSRRMHARKGSRSKRCPKIAPTLPPRAHRRRDRERRARPPR